MSQKLFKTMIVLMILGSILVAGCGITQSEAEATSRTFVSTRVKFYGVLGNESQDIPQYNLTHTTTVKRDGVWEVRYLAWTEIASVTKEKNITVCVQSDGQVVKFNAKGENC